MSTETPKQLAVIILASKVDEEHSKKITDIYDKLGIRYAKRIGSAHKTPEHVLEIIRSADKLSELGWQIVYNTIAGRSDGLSAFSDAETLNPIIAAPPYSDKYGGVDIFSSLRVPSGIGLTIVADPESAALGTAKIFSLSNPDLRLSYNRLRLMNRLKISQDDAIYKQEFDQLLYEAQNGLI